MGNIKVKTVKLGVKDTNCNNTIQPDTNLALCTGSIKCKQSYNVNIMKLLSDHVLVDITVQNTYLQVVVENGGEIHCWLGGLLVYNQISMLVLKIE